LKSSDKTKIRIKIEELIHENQKVAAYEKKERNFGRRESA